MPPFDDQTMSDKKKDDLKDVMTGETRRGRRPVDLETIRRKRERDSLLRKLLTLATEEEFLEAMRVYGLADGSDEMAAALAAWREFRP
jgi:hypothetical protein